MNDATAVLGSTETPEPKPDWQCRTNECTQAVFGTPFCSACMILFGPWEILTANPHVQVWEPDEHLVEAEPEPEPAEKPPTARRRTRTPKAKPDAG